jgi:uncharacterized phage protein (TIGR02218 family)
MSTFDALESSVESSRPIELYAIVLGSQSYTYTSAEDTITVSGQDYVPEAIARGRVEQGSDSSDRTVLVTLPSTNPFAAQFIENVPGEKATVTIYRYQRDESPSLATQVLLFKGTVQSVRFPQDGSTAEIAVRSIETALNRNVPKFTFMGMCNHFLYDQNCGVNPSTFSHAGLVTAEAETQITVSGAAASGFDFTGGYARPIGANDFRLIIAQSGDDMTLILPFSDPIEGGNVQLFAGCDHLIDGDCALVFNNVANFGGFAFVPNRNVFQIGLGGKFT